MAELTTQERLQPSLLDRLTDSTRVKERAELAVSEQALTAAGMSREALRALLGAHDLHLLETRAGEKGEADIQVYESRPGILALNRAMEHSVQGSAERTGVPLRDLVEVVSRCLIPNTAESQRERVISDTRLREAVLRDLSWLLNTGSLAAVQELGSYPRVQCSVINYGIPDLAGTLAPRADMDGAAAAIRRAIEAFEPRLRRVRVTPSRETDRPGGNCVGFLIEAELWAQPTSEPLFLHTELEIETASAVVRDAGALADR
ncbi:MAG: type VI secretion system baseplate subunit TssE [Nitrococcus sp.]|nr:type VI secretion system baseplate subunit TssE [Nitrococcus sp.]